MKVLLTKILIDDDDNDNDDKNENLKYLKKLNMI